MATDDERREVARRLRGIKDTREGCGHELCCDLWAAVFDSDYRCTDLYDECELAVLDSLADLIEPSCDRDALLDMEDEMFESATGLALISELEEDADLKDLQTTMAKVLFGYARRVREACGEAE